MGHVNTVFHQVLAFINKNRFKGLVEKHQADRYVKSFKSWPHLVAMLFAQATGKDSLRELKEALNAQGPMLYHLGAKPIARSTLADANERRDAQLFQDLYMNLMAQFQNLRPNHPFKFKNPLLTIDSTVIDLCLSLYPWAQYRKKKGAFKLHCRLNHEGYLPETVIVTEGKKHDIKLAGQLVDDLLPDSIVSFDRGYNDYNFMYSLNKKNVYFVTRPKKDLGYQVIGQHSESKKKNVLSDEIIAIKKDRTRKKYPEPLRLVKVFDTKRNKIIAFITNNFKLAASTIAEIYKARWQIEIFFKWIKQRLKIKSFMGTSKNAVLIQIWAAIIYYLILSYIKAQCRYPKSIHLLAQILSVCLFHHVTLIDLLAIEMKNIHRINDPPLLQFKLPFGL
jgi:hypothetical protein